MEHGDTGCDRRDAQKPEIRCQTAFWRIHADVDAKKMNAS
jgi:hypothetical protein